MNFRNTIRCVLLSFLCTYSPAHGMMDYVSNLVWGTKPLSQQEARDIKNELTTYKDTIIDALDDMKKTSDRYEKKSTPGANDECVMQSYKDSITNQINQLIKYITLDHYVTFSQEGNRLKKLENTIEQITEKFSANEIEKYKANITDVHDTTHTMITSILNNQSSKTQLPLESSAIIFNKVQAKNKKLRFINSPTDIISYINAQKWDEAMRTFILQLLWSNEFYRSRLNTSKDASQHQDKLRLFSKELNTLLPIFNEEFGWKTKLPKLNLSFDDFKKSFEKVNCDELLKKLIYDQINILILIEDQNKKQAKLEQATIIKNLEIAINKKEKNQHPITIKELENYLKEVQKLLNLEKSSLTETVIINEINKINIVIKKIETTIEEIEKKIKLTQAKEATTKIQQELKTKKNNKQVSSIKDLQNYIQALNKELSLLDSDEGQKEELTTRISNAVKLIEAIEEKELIKKNAMDQRNQQKELVKNDPTKENLVVYRNLLVIFLESRPSEMKKQEIQQCLEDIDEQLNKIETLESLQKKLDSTDTLYSLHGHAKSITQSHMPKLTPSSCLRPFDKAIIENLTQCLQKINTKSITKEADEFYYLIELIDTLASHFEIPNNNNNIITLNDDVILKFKEEYLTLTKNLMTSLDATLDKDKKILESLQKNIVQVAGQDQLKIIMLEIGNKKLKIEISEIKMAAEITKKMNEQIKIEIDQIERENEIEKKKNEIDKKKQEIKIADKKNEEALIKIKQIEIELELEKKTQQNLEQDKIDKEKIDALAALTALLERYNFKDPSPAQLIHYNPKTIESDLTTLNNNTYILLGLEEDCKLTVVGLTNIQKELQQASKTINAYKNFLSFKNHALTCINNTCNHINDLIKYLPTKPLTDSKNPQYQILIETLLKYVDLIEKCSDLKVTDIKQLENLINTLKKYEKIDPENINKAIETATKNLDRLKKIKEKINFYSQLSENELLFHNPKVLIKDNNSLYPCYTKEIPFSLTTIELNISSKTNEMKNYCKNLLPLNNSSYTHIAQINKIISNLDNLKDIENLSTKIIEYKKNSLYTKIIKTINFCLKEINNDQTNLDSEFILQLKTLNKKFKTYAEFDKENFNPMIQQLEEIINKKPINPELIESLKKALEERIDIVITNNIEDLGARVEEAIQINLSPNSSDQQNATIVAHPQPNQFSQVPLLEQSSTTTVDSQDNTQPQNNQTNFTNQHTETNNSKNQVQITINNQSSTTKAQQPAPWSLWTTIKSFLSWFAFWTWFN